MGKKKWRICYHVDAVGWSDIIEADTAEEAEQMDEFVPDDINTELGDVIAVLEIQEVDADG